MACSKYVSTKQTTNAARVCRLLLDPCTDMLRDVLRNYITEKTFPAKLQTEILTLKPLLNASQRALLYPQQGTFSGSYQDLDISLLYLLLRNITGIPKHAKGWGKTPGAGDRSISANIERIRFIRNTYLGHISQSAMPDSTFNSLWKDVRNITLELVKDVGLNTDYVILIDILEHETMDPEQEQAYLKKLHDTEKTVADLTDQQQKQREMQINQFAVQNKIQEVQYQQRATIVKHEELLNEQGQVQTEHGDQLKLLKECLDQEVKNILENTDTLLTNHQSSRSYIRTRQVDAVLQRLREKNIVVLTGRPGDGKSTIAKQVLCELSTDVGCIPAIITEPNQWNKVINAKQRLAVYIDDIFGSTNVDASAIDKWKKMFDLMISSANEGNTSILISSRKNIIAEVRKSCNERFLIRSEYEIDLTSITLTVNEKENMLLQYENENVYRASDMVGDKFRKYESQYGKDAVYKLTKWEKAVIVKSEPYYGFPQTCFLFFERKEFFQRGADFFVRPNITLFNNIDNMRKSTDGKVKMCYLVLAYVFVEGGIHIFNEKKDLFEEICRSSNFQNWTEIDIEDAVQDLEGVYLSLSSQKHVYTFCHETIKEAVVASFGKLAPKIVIQNCSNKTICELIRTEGYEAQDGEVTLTVRKNYYRLLANRLLTEETDYGAYHPATDDPEFISVLFDMVNKPHHNSCTIIHNLWRSIMLKDKPLLYKEILTRYGPHHSKHKTEYGCYAPVDKHDIDASVEVPNIITRRDVKRYLDYNLNKGYKQNVMSIIRYVISINDIHYFLDFYTKENNIPGMSVLHCCVVRDWTDVINEILNVSTATKTEKNWSCLHFAAFFGRTELFKKFENLSSNVLETTQEECNILQVVLLGLRHGINSTNFDLSIVESFDTSMKLRETPGKESDFINIIEHLLIRYPSLITSIDMSLDCYNNNIIHYLVIHDRVEIYDMLVRKKNNLIFHRNDTNLPTTLHVAAYLGRVKFVEKLWKAGIRAQGTDLSIADSTESGKLHSNKNLTHVIDTTSNQWIDQQYNIAFNVKLKCIPYQQIQFGCTDDYITICSICTVDF